MQKATFLDTKTLGEDVSLQSLKDLPLEWTFFESTSPQETLKRVSDCSIVVSNKVVLTREILQKCPQLQLICVAATGYNNVDINAAKELGIKVCNIPNYSTPSVVQFTITFLLALSTNLLSYVEATREGRWQKSSQFCFLDYPIIELAGKKLGIIGYGSLGKQVAQIARSFGMEILISAHTERKTQDGTYPLEQVLKESDFITIHVPLTQQTKDLIRKEQIRLMKPTAFLINTARGGIVNEKDLADSLKEKLIAGAAVDVLTTEPPSSDNPLIQNIPNLLLTPHIGWASLESRERLINILKENISSFLQGNSSNVVGAN